MCSGCSQELPRQTPSWSCHRSSFRPVNYVQAAFNKHKKLKRTFYLKFAPLGVQWKGIKHHGAYECDVGGLRVVDAFLGVNPESRQFRQNIDSFEGFQVVNKYIG